MQFTASQLQQFVLGCDRIEEVDGAYRFHRIPIPMHHLYEAPHASGRRACTSSVRFRFVSDSRSLRVNFRYGPEARSYYQGSLLVDGNDPLAFGPTERVARWDGVIFEQPQHQQRLFELWLPHLVQTDLISLEVEQGARVEAAPRHKHRWLAYGDSITQGLTARLPTNTHVARLVRALDADVLNLGIGGAVLDAELSQTVPDFDYDVVSIAYGTNDSVKAIIPDTYAQRARNLLTALTQRHPDRPIVLITVLTWTRPNEPNEFGCTLADYRKALEPIAREFNNVTLVPGDQMIPARDEWFVDRVHPSDEGFALYAQNLLPYMQQALRVSEPAGR